MDLSGIGTSSVLIFLTAVLFSSLGMGGSAGYLAVFSLLSLPAATTSTSVLSINVIVTGITVLSFLRAGHRPLASLWPFLATSIPAAFLGGSLHLKDSTYSLLLALALCAAAIGVAIVPHKQEEHPDPRVVRSMSTSFLLPLIAGSILGLVAGTVGIGGGVLLSPVLILLRWDTVRRIAATTATFSLVNSLAGLCGRCVSTSIDLNVIAPLVAAACLGALLGSRLGARTLSPPHLRKVLAVVLVGVASHLAIATSGLHVGKVWMAFARATQHAKIAAQKQPDVLQ